MPRCVCMWDYFLGSVSRSRLCYLATDLALRRGLLPFLCVRSFIQDKETESFRIIYHCMFRLKQLKHIHSVFKVKVNGFTRPYLLLFYFSSF